MNCQLGGRADPACQNMIQESIPSFASDKHGYFGVDIGGSLCKIVFYEPNGDASISKLRKFVAGSTTYGSTGQRDANLSISTKHGQFHFVLFETRRMDAAINLILAADLFSESHPKSPVMISITGGGSFRFAHLFEKFRLGTRKMDEMRCLVTGLNFLLKHIKDECFFYPMPDLKAAGFYDELKVPEREYFDTTEQSPGDMFPYMLVNIGTGVSICKVNADGSYERISGSGIGGGTYWGLARLLTKSDNFNDSLKLSTEGNSRNVDMTVGDIYGGDYASLGLPANMTAGFFAKFAMKDNDSLRENVSDADIYRGLLLMITNNIGQISYLLAKLHSIKYIFFSGTFLRHSNEVTIAPIALSRAISFWSNNEMNALFLRHEGYFGALGAFLGEHPDLDHYQPEENHSI